MHSARAQPAMCAPFLLTASCLWLACGKTRAVLEGKKKRRKVRNANRNERSRVRSLLHGQHMGKTQNDRNSIEQWLAVGGHWRWQLVVGGGGGRWRLAVSGWERLVGGWR